MDLVIKQTSDYSIFNLHLLNRKVKEDTKKFKNLLVSMRKQGFINATPLHCNLDWRGRLVLKAGHNRLRAAQLLGIPVLYVISEDTATIQEIEPCGPGQWVQADYLDSYSKQGLESYVVIKRFMQQTGIGLGCSASMHYGQTAGSHSFKTNGGFCEGTFKIKELRHPFIVGSIVLLLKGLRKPWASQDNMVKALSRMVKLKEFDSKHFMKKAKLHEEFVRKQKTCDECLKNIEDVYNRGSNIKDRVPLAFLAQKLLGENKIMSQFGNRPA